MDGKFFPFHAAHHGIHVGNGLVHGLAVIGEAVGRHSRLFARIVEVHGADLKAVALLCTFNYAGVLLAQPLQLLGYGLFTPASVYFVNESVPEADRVRGQTVMMVASNGMGGMLGGLLAGWTLDMGGANWMPAACIACGCAGAALCWAALRCPAWRTV